MLKENKDDARREVVAQNKLFPKGNRSKYLRRALCSCIGTELEYSTDMAKQCDV